MTTPPSQDIVNCPQCGANGDKRVESGGFGRQVRDVCGVCGYEFQEHTQRDEVQA